MTPAEKLRDTIVTAVSREMNVPVENIMNRRSRRRQAADARRISMWIVREALEQSDLPEEINVATLFGVQMKTADHACQHLWKDAALFEVAQRLLNEQRAAS